MRSALNSQTAPSLLLLKFLKAQSEGTCLFKSRHSYGIKFSRLTPRNYQVQPLKAICINSSAKGSNSIIYTSTCQKLKTLESYQAASCCLSRCIRPKKFFSGNFNTRHLSLRSLKPWFTNLWNKRSSKAYDSVWLDNLKSHTEENHDASMFSLGCHISAKAAAQPKIRCTEVNENGNVVFASGEFKKSELIARVCYLLSINVYTKTDYSMDYSQETFGRLIQVFYLISLSALPQF